MTKIADFGAGSVTVCKKLQAAYIELPRISSPQLMQYLWVGSVILFPQKGQ